MVCSFGMILHANSQTSMIKIGPSGLIEDGDFFYGGELEYEKQLSEHWAIGLTGNYNLLKEYPFQADLRRTFWTANSKVTYYTEPSGDGFNINISTGYGQKKLKINDPGLALWLASAEDPQPFFNAQGALGYSLPVSENSTIGFDAGAGLYTPLKNEHGDTEALYSFGINFGFGL